MNDFRSVANAMAVAVCLAMALTWTIGKSAAPPPTDPLWSSQ